jgi:hypothetical protein
MKYLVVSDIHGSVYYARIVEELFKSIKPDKLILLGDLYYHGPRNPLTKEYSPSEVANILNKYKDKILCVRGNCDAEVDMMISDFKFEDNITLTINGKRYFFTHGHKYNLDNIPRDIDVLIYGHLHTGFIKDKDGVIVANAGSISLPKNNTPNSYIILDGESITLMDIDGNTIDKRFTT